MNGVVNPPPRKLRWVLQPNISFPNGLCPLPLFPVRVRVRGPCRVYRIPGGRADRSLNLNLSFCGQVFDVYCARTIHAVISNRLFIPIPRPKFKNRGAISSRPCAYLRAWQPACLPACLLSSLVSHDITINVLTFTTPPLHTHTQRERERERDLRDHQPGAEKM